MSASAHIMWFRQDLRLGDNPALCAACENGPLIAVYVLDDETPGPWRMGGASRWWLDKSLSALDQSLKKHGIDLLLRQGPADRIIPDLAQEIGAASVHWNRCYEPYAIARDARIKERLKQQGIHGESHNGSLLYEPWTIQTGQGDPYRVFTPFWRACRQFGDPATPLPPPEKISAAPSPESERLRDWNLHPKHPDWSVGLKRCWKPGEAGARMRLASFLDVGLENYKQGRDRPDLENVSMISPHLHWGEISPRQVWTAVRAHVDRNEAFSLDNDVERFLTELGWREFSYHLLYHFPNFPEKNYNRRFDDFPWQEPDKKMLAAWQKGQTGYPIVDAGMRQLWQTGYMHNRVRMVVASFLTKDLRYHWRWGEDWFWDTLVDADLANNSASWQWTAGSGADAAPYFRIFNPVRQGERFDPEGAYVRRYVPELKDLDTKWIHQPWQAPPEALSMADIRLGETYPHPIVDHGQERDKALAAYEKIKASNTE